MDYLGQVNGSFNLDIVHSCVAYFKDGSQQLIDLSDLQDYSFEGFCGRVANNVNRFGDYNTLDLVGFSYLYDIDEVFYVSTTLNDFYVWNLVNISSSFEGTIYISGVRVNTDVGQDIDEYVQYENYAQLLPIGSAEYIQSDLYGYYTGNLNSDYTISAFDYTNLHYDNNNITAYLQDSIAIRGENVSFYNSYFHIININGLADLRISFGNPYNQIAKDNYQAGYGNGHSDGYIQGMDEGFRQGQNNPNVTVQEASAFSYIGTAFNSVGELLAIEIMPNITLGLCFSIPLSFVIIMTIFKLVRK